MVRFISVPFKENRDAGVRPRLLVAVPVFDFIYPLHGKEKGKWITPDGVLPAVSPRRR